MGGSECCVKKCGRSSHDHRGRRLVNGLTFHCFPAWRTNEGGHISELTRRRRAAWVAAVSRSDISFSRIPSSMRVCSRHFRSGKPAFEMLDSDPDWAPSLHLGHDEAKSSRPRRRLQRKKRRLTEETPAGGCPREEDQDQPEYEDQDQIQPEYEDQDQNQIQPEYEDQDQNQIQPEYEDRDQDRAEFEFEFEDQDQNQYGDRDRPEFEFEDQNLSEFEDQAQPAEKRTDISLRDFFRTALEASLEASIRSRTQSKTRSSELEVELNLKVPPTANDDPSSSSTSSSSQCLNCVRLQGRVEELEKKLFRLVAEQQDRDLHLGPRTPPTLGPVLQDPLLESPDEDEEENFIEIVEYIQPDGGVLQDLGVDTRSSSCLPPAVSRIRQRCPRFRKEWLDQFSFLRYSQSQNLMWCHVCRVQADKAHQNLGLIKGSRDFQRASLKKHSNTKYHRDNMERWTNQL